MTKKLKSILISLFVLMPLLLAGFFLVGCGIDYDKISIVAEQSSIELNVGEQQTLTFQIKGYQKGFSNRVEISKGQSGVFGASDPVYVEEDTIRLTVTGLTGGNGELTVTTLEAHKSCTVQIGVRQVSQSMTLNRELLYVSGSTPFVPNANMFDFADYTTNRQLSYYYMVQNSEENLNEFHFKGLRNEQTEAGLVQKAVFGLDEKEIDCEVLQIDKIQLEQRDGVNCLIAYFNNVQKQIDISAKFKFLTLYEPSLENENSEAIFNVSDVYVLNDLNVVISGGYLQQNGEILQINGEKGFAPLVEESVNADGTINQKIMPITIVPNRSKYVEYIMKVELLGRQQNADIDFKLSKSNDDVVTDFTNFEETGASRENVYYVKISQNALHESTTKLSLQVFYDVAKNVDDESINIMQDFVVNTEIAPSDITVNGLIEPKPLVLYTYNRDGYGWQNLLIDVISNFQTSPSFQGVYFVYTDSAIEMTTYNGTPILQGEEHLYADLDKPFRVRGKNNINPTDSAEIYVYVKLSGALSASNERIPNNRIVCSVKAGAQFLSVDSKYERQSCFYVDYEKDYVNDNVNFDGQVYANSIFQNVTVEHYSGKDILDIMTADNVYIKKDGKFFLNLLLSPKAEGTGTYRFILDNGVSKDFAFSCRKFLKKSNTEFGLSPTGNSAVTDYEFSSTEGDFFNNKLSLEILNSSTKNSVIAKSSASFYINAATSDLRPSQAGNSVVLSQNGNQFILTTTSNGDTEIQFVLRGPKLVENDFILDEHETQFDIWVSVSAYSLVDEFYLESDGTQATSQNVYYGSSSITDKETRAEYKAIANFSGSNNFFQYEINSSYLQTIFESKDMLEFEDENGNTLYAFEFSNDSYSQFISAGAKPKKEIFDKKFVYFTALDSNGRSIRTFLNGTVTKTQNGNVVGVKHIRFAFENGMMIWMDKNATYTMQYLDNGNLVEYALSFQNVVYNLDNYGTFDMETLTYTNFITSECSISLSASLRQREKTSRFDSQIFINKYETVESISLSTALDQIDFSNKTFSTTIGIFTYPVTSTNNEIKVEFVPTGNNPYPTMVQWKINRNSASSGIFAIKLSCENFLKKHSKQEDFESGEFDGDFEGEYVDDDDTPIEQISANLTGEVYIYPTEWGSSYTSLIEGHAPIKIFVHFRNGSRANPYVLETAEDVANINSDAMLRSHFEIRSRISMASTEMKNPIGIIDGKLQGFSGSIIGTTNQAEIADVFVSNANLCANVDGNTYAGLFARLNKTSSLENFKISGKMDLNLETGGQTAYAGLLAAQNYAEILNVGATLDNSAISGQTQKLYFGAIAGVNYGKITQDFRFYDGTGYIYHKFAPNVGPDDENKKQFEDGIGFVKKFRAEIKTDDVLGDYVLVDEKKIRVDAQGFAVDENGIRIKFDDSGTQLLPSRDFEGQTSRNMAFFNGMLTINIDGNVYAGGVSGASSGQIVRISPTLNTFKLYGYTSYSAYTQISVAGSPEKVFLGGIVGILSYCTDDENLYSMPDFKNENVNDENGNLLQNLLVGGKLSTLSVTGGEDCVGGLVGFASTMGISPIQILGNTSRTFVKGIEYVGGLVGFENVSRGDNQAQRFIQYSENGQKWVNVFDAVDDGEPGLAASSIIRVAQEGLEFKEKDTTFMIGNSEENGREYVGDLFEIGTYVSRELTPLIKDQNENLNLISGTQDSYYGDFVVVKRNETNGLPNGTYDLLQAFKFAQKTVNLEIEDGKFAMKIDPKYETQGFVAPHVYFMYYFHVETDLSGQLGAMAQEEIESLNYISPSMKDSFYPFELKNPEISISSSSRDILDVDVNGNITIHGTGIATLTLSSILNTNVNMAIYIYVVNFFNSDISSSIFFASKTGEGRELDETTFTIYGNSYVDLYMVPNYSLSNVKTANGESFSVTADGILSYKNVAYVLSRNTQLSPESKFDDENTQNIGSGFSSTETIGQKIVFYKTKTPVDGARNAYNLVPILRTTIRINGKDYVFFKVLENAKSTVFIDYKETATNIGTTFDKYLLETNRELTETVHITTTNPPEKELLFYEIRKTGDASFDQSRAPWDGFNFNDEDGNFNDEAYLSYLNGAAAVGYSALSDNLFDFNFSRVAGTNDFKFVLRVNKNSNLYKNRFKSPISGTYVFHFYASNINSKDRRVEYAFYLELVEAELNYVSVSNYSNIRNVSSPDKIVEPGTKGLLEITVNPMEAVFDRFTISNNEINNAVGAGKAQFMFAYKTATGFEDTTFGSFQNGNVLTFTYDEMMADIESMQNRGKQINQYNGKIYVSYFLPSLNVDDKVPVAFDIRVTPINKDVDEQFTKIELTTKLGSFAKLVLDDKSIVGDGYYVARGLSYNVSLQSFGFDEDQVIIRVDNTADVKLADLSDGHDFGLFTLKGQNGQFVLTVTSDKIPYDGGTGFELEITTIATKKVDKVTVTNTNILRLYLMEYVLNYQYVVGDNEDLVEGMNDGIVNIAVGNPFVPKLDIWDFLEYDNSNASVVREVQSFVDEMTENIQWKVVLLGDETILSKADVIKTNYYHIKGLTITPISIYRPEENVYHFTMEGYFRIFEGRYKNSSSSQGANLMHTEFSFNVHDQSTQDSPIPLYSYEDLLKMQDEGQDGWYILLNDINIPNATYCAEHEMENFAPLNVELAGLDGNGFAFNFSGIYNFDTSSVGLFAQVSDDTILQNITIRLQSDVTFRMSSETFDVGLLAAENNGIITNAQTEADDFSFAVTSSVTTSEANVAGLVAENNGYITNSRTTVDITSSYDMSGFVGQNTGKIVSSYFRGASLENVSFTTKERTAGFVLENTGEIRASYVSGDLASKDMPNGEGNQDSMCYLDESAQADSITSGNDIAGFVFSNSGDIIDCYSNIYLYQNGTAAGFVFENSSNIERCFSTSILANRNAESFGFARQNSVVNDNLEIQGGTIVDCYFLQHKHKTTEEDKYPDINYSIKNLIDDEKADIVALDVENFEFQIDENGQMNLPKALEEGKDKGRVPFENFVVAKGRNINSVWFFNNDATDNIGFNDVWFNTGRLELVSANIKARSERELLEVQSVVDEETGAEYKKFVYAYRAGTNPLGSEYNPITVSNADEFENYMKREADMNMNNFSYYRLISDVDYNGFESNSTLCDVNFMGYLEGNFMSIEGVSMISNSSRLYGGLFAKIGGERNAIGTLMNFSYSPNTISFANTDVVGALAGRLENGTIINVDILLNANGRSMVVGENISGGAIGMTAGNFKIRNLHSQFGAVARRESSTDATFDPKANQFSAYSFAGSLVGAVSGVGQIYDVHCEGDLTVMANKAGLLFGFVGNQSTISKISLETNGDMLLNGYSYAGLVVGETQGNFEDVQISGSNVFNAFKISPHLPNAVGCFAGRVTGGTIENLNVMQNINMSTESDSVGIEYIGGVAGQISGNVSMKKLVVRGSIVGFMYAGGVAGQITNSANTSFEDVDVDVDLSVLGRSIEQIGIGGLVGEVASGAIIKLTASRTDNFSDEQSENLAALETKQDNIDKMERLSSLPNEIKSLHEQISGLQTQIEAAAEDEALKTELEAEKTQLENNLDVLKESLPGLIEQVNAIGKDFDKAEDIATLDESGESITKTAEYDNVYAEIQKEISQLVNSLSNGANLFDVGAYAHAYVYAEQFEGHNMVINVGAIIGRNLGGVQSVFDTYSNLHSIQARKGEADIVIDDLSTFGGETETFSACVKADEKTGDVELTPKNSDGIISTKIAAARSYAFCDLTLKKGKSDQYRAFLTLYGNLYVPQKLN